MLLLALYSEASEDQLAQLKELGCEMAQGFYFAEPLPSEAVESLLREGISW
jgi:EAL domain-containing protein (putative c-di-GMP-specific phosphodiesterase class I)